MTRVGLLDCSLTSDPFDARKPKERRRDEVKEQLVDAGLAGWKSATAEKSHTHGLGNASLEPPLPSITPFAALAAHENGKGKKRPVQMLVIPMGALMHLAVVTGV